MLLPATDNMAWSVSFRAAIVMQSFLVDVGAMDAEQVQNWKSSIMCWT